MPANRKARITRRGFLQVGSSAAIAAGVLSSSANSETALPSASLSGKIALEEHFDFPATASSATLLPAVPNSSARFRIWAAGASQRWTAEAWKFAFFLWSGPASKRIRTRAKLPKSHGKQMIIWLKTSPKIRSV